MEIVTTRLSIVVRFHACTHCVHGMHDELSDNLGKMQAHK